MFVLILVLHTSICIQSSPTFSKPLTLSMVLVTFHDVKVRSSPTDQMTRMDEFSDMRDQNKNGSQLRMNLRIGLPVEE